MTALPILPNDFGTAGRHNFGPYGSEAATLAVLCERLASGLRPLEIRLFGSRGRGAGTPDADFDLLIIFDDEAGEAALDYDRAYAPVLGLGIGCDVIPCLLSDYEADRNIPGTVSHDASQGRLLYRRSV